MSVEYIGIDSYTATAQTISCVIKELGKAADITWKDPEGNAIVTGDTTNYIVDEGKGSFSPQTTKLTLKSTKVSSIREVERYTCSVTPTLYPGSPSFEKSVVVVPTGKLH